MFNVTQSFLDKIKLGGREFNSTVIIRDTIFNSENIVDLSLSENVNPADSFMLGSVASNVLEVNIKNIPGTLVLEGAKVTSSISLNTGAAFEDVPLGVFWVDDIKKDNGSIKLTCVDNMIKLEKAYFSNLTYPVSINSVAQEICTKAGVEFATTLPNILINKIEGYTYREAISFIASFLGGFARFNRLGRLEITSYTDTAVEITGGNYSKLKTNEKPFTIGKLSCKAGENILSAGSNGNEIKFENPIMTQEQLNSIYNVLKNISYMPYTMDWIGNHALQAGDKIRIIDVYGNIHNTFLMQQKISCKGSISSTASAVGKTEVAQEFSSSGSIKNSVNRMVVEQANIKILLAEKATIEDLTATNGRIDNLSSTYATIVNLNAATARIGTLEATTATITQLDASNARITNLESTSATITALNASNAKITTLESKTASIDNLLAGNLTAANMQAGFITAESGLIANGAIKDAMILNLSANKINTGTVDTNKVTIQSSSGNMLISDNTIQIKDATRVRVQIGKDASNDYNMYVWDSSGNLMFDAAGLKASGIKDKIIRDDMVSDTANINGSKLEINSVVSSINGATTLLKATKVKLDTENQTLDVAFTSLKSTVTSQGSTITSQGTSISTIQGQISSKIWTSDITTAINNVQIGARNLLQNSTGALGTQKWASGIVSEAKYGYSSLKVSNSGTSEVIKGSTRFSLKPNTKYTISFYITSDENLYNADMFLLARKLGSLNDFDYAPSKASIIPSTDKFDYIVWTYTTPSDVQDAYIRLDNNKTKTAGVTANVWFSRIKVEEGDKDTDWVPAIEDVQGQIDCAVTRISTAESSITQLNNSIVLKVNTSDYNTKMTSLDSSITSINSTLSTQSSSISVLQGQITSKVTQTEIDNSINAIQIGGRNLLRNTSNFANLTYWGLSKGSGQDGIIELISDSIYGKVIHVTKPNSVSWWVLYNNLYTYFPLKFDTTKKYTISIHVKSLNGTSLSVGFMNSNGTNLVLGSTSLGVIPNAWIKVSKTFTPAISGDIPQLYITGNIDEYWITNIKLEIGSKSTDYTPSPEDVQSQIDSAVTRITTAESSITQLNNSIALKVETSEFNSYKASNDSAVSALSSRVSTAELKITDSAIVSTVRSSTAYTNDLSVKANQSSLEATNSNVSSLTSRMSSAESSITQNTSNIALKVSTTDYNGNTIASLINQSDTTIKLQASKIDLSGYVTITALGTAGQTSINGSNLITGTITADKLDIRAKELINNFSKSNSLIGWAKNNGTATWTLEVDTSRNSFKRLNVTGEGDTLFASSYIEVDPTKSYKVAFSMMYNNTVGQHYFGLYAYDATQSAINVIPFVLSSRSFGIPTANPYFYNITGKIGDGTTYRDMEAYIMGCNSTEKDMPNGLNVNNFFKMYPQTKYIQIRFLHYYMGTTVTTAYFSNPSMSEVGVGEINASQINAGTLTLGGASNGNGTQIIKDASGNNLMVFSKDGLLAKSGSIQLITGIPDLSSYGMIPGETRTVLKSTQVEVNYTNAGASANWNSKLDAYGLTLESTGGVGANPHQMILSAGQADLGRSRITTQQGLEFYCGSNHVARISNTGQLITNQGALIGCSVTGNTPNHSPSVTLAIGDNDTGFHWVSDGKLSFRANSSEKAMLDTSGFWCYVGDYGAAAITGNPARIGRSTDRPAGSLVLQFGNTTSKFEIINSAWSSSLYHLDYAGNCRVAGTLTATSKSAVTDTMNYGEITTYCDESPNHVFNDRGRGTLDEYGKCYIFLDPILLETINTKSTDYWVFLSGFSGANVEIKELQPDYFVVTGIPGKEFMWMISAERLGYERLRFNDAIIG